MLNCDEHRVPAQPSRKQGALDRCRQRAVKQSSISQGWSTAFDPLQSFSHPDKWLQSGYAHRLCRSSGAVLGQVFEAPHDAATNRGPLHRRPMAGARPGPVYRARRLQAHPNLPAPRRRRPPFPETRSARLCAPTGRRPRTSGRPRGVGPLREEFLNVHECITMHEKE